MFTVRRGLRRMRRFQPVYRHVRHHTSDRHTLVDTSGDRFSTDGRHSHVQVQRSEGTVFFSHDNVVVLK